MLNTIKALFLSFLLTSTVVAQTLVLATMDIRRAPTSAPLVHRTNVNTMDSKTVSMLFYTGDLFIHNPLAHMWLMTDGYVDASVPKASLQGRGITFGHTNFCDGVGFEHFGVNAGFNIGCVRFDIKPNSFYELFIYTDTELVSFNVTGPNVDEGSYLEFNGSYPSFDTVMGVAEDYNSATYGFFNLHQSIGD